MRRGTSPANRKFPFWACRTIVFFVFLGCAPVRQHLPAGKGVSGYTAEARKDAEGLRNNSSSSPRPWEAELEGDASWYGREFHGHLTASGEVYDMYGMTAAHRTLPLGTEVEVENLETGQRVRVRINDRGPFVAGRVIDLSRKAGKALGIREKGVAKVRLHVKRLGN